MPRAAARTCQILGTRDCTRRRMMHDLSNGRAAKIEALKSGPFGPFHQTRGQLGEARQVQSSKRALRKGLTYRAWVASRTVELGGGCGCGGLEVALKAA
jgi:hypothetical protein